MRTLASILSEFPDARTRGLTSADVETSRGKFGSNKLTPLSKDPIWLKFLEKFDEPIIKILLGASLLKIVVDLFEHWPLIGGIALAVAVIFIGLVQLLKRGQWLPTLVFVLAIVLFCVTCFIGYPSVEGLAVIVAVVLATGVSFLSEYRSDQEFEKLNSHKDAVPVKVLRDQRVTTVPLEDVAVGDVIILETGDEIPVDGRLLLANGLMVDQSLLTGESEPSAKKPTHDLDETDGPDKLPCVYRGTQVIDGLGQMMATHVGDDTMLGQIARRLGDTTEETASSEARVQQKLTINKEETPLQQKLTRLAGTISMVGYIAAVAIFLALLVRGVFFSTPREVYWASDLTGWLAVAKNLLGYVVYMVIIIVVAVPEGLPMSVTVSLALAMRKMTRAKALVRQLVATETIGSATVICSDKTGTLTQNKMQVLHLALSNELHIPADAEAIPTPARGARPLPTRTADWLALNSAVNSTGTLDNSSGSPVVVGNRTEGALLLWLNLNRIDYAAERLHHPVLYRATFSSEHKKMTTVGDISGVPVVFVKGAPEILLQSCSYITTPSGIARPLTDADRQRISMQLTAVAAQAMRTLAFAHRVLPANTPRTQDDLTDLRAQFEAMLVFDGFVAIRDPIRDDVPGSIERCRAAGIEVKMITGDNPETARAIARDIGLLEDHATLMTSDEFNAKTDDEIKAELPSLKVLARAKPLDKYRLVKLLQEQDHVVAMTGDGTNDAPSLRKADVGLAMGISGTEVAKEASRIVLLDDAFSTIVKAVHWGRSLYENIQKFIVFQLTINASALLIAFLGPFFGVKPPFTVLQLLWINVIMDTFAAMALCSEPPRKGLMKQPPKKRNESIVTKEMLVTIGLTGGFFVIVMMAMLLWMFSGNVELSTRNATIFFTVYVFFQVWNQINCRSLDPAVPGWRGLFKNPFFLVIASATVIGQVLIVNLGASTFAVEPLGWLDWLWITVGTSSVLLFAEVCRWFRRLKPARV
jgi:P-type Ca2+ transporter type 2C